LAVGVFALDGVIREAENDARAARGEPPLRSTRKRFARTFGPVALATTAVAPFAANLTVNSLNLMGIATRNPPPPVEGNFITMPRVAPVPFDDRNARTTYADLHDRQHNYLSLNWTDVAASTTTQVFSPYAIDQTADVGVTLSSHRMFAGQVSEFEQSAILAFAERSVGGIGGDISRQPSLVA
jgi:hypothetical protein